MITAGQAGDITRRRPCSKARRAARPRRQGLRQQRLRALIAAIGAEAVIPSNRTRKKPHPPRRAIYRRRNHIERCFNKLKHFRRFATRYDRRAAHFLAFIHLACAMLWMR